MLSHPSRIVAPHACLATHPSDVSAKALTVPACVPALSLNWGSEAKVSKCEAVAAALMNERDECQGLVSFFFPENGIL
jgi:ribosome biogenesis protein Tsr3